MRLGFRTSSVRGQTESLARRLAAVGYNWMELDAPWEPDSAREGELRALAGELGLDISVHCHFVDINLSSPYHPVRKTAVEVIKADLDFAGRIGARAAVIHPGDLGWFDFLPPEHPYFREAQDVIDHLRVRHEDALARSLEEVTRHGEKLGVRLVMENMYCPWEFLTGPGELASFLRKHRFSNLGINLDFGHALVAGYDPADYVDALGGAIWHTHIHDNDGKYDIHLPLVPGKAEHFRTGLNKLIQANPDVTLLIELAPRYPGEYLDSLTALRELLPAGSPAGNGGGQGVA